MLILRSTTNRGWPTLLAALALANYSLIRMLYHHMNRRCLTAGAAAGASARGVRRGTVAAEIVLQLAERAAFHERRLPQNHGRRTDRGDHHRRRSRRQPSAALAARKRTFATLVADLRTMRARPLRAARGRRAARGAAARLARDPHLRARLVLGLWRARAQPERRGGWWVLLTALAGFLYVELMYSDPGFIRGPELQALCDRQGLDLLVGGTDVSRGLLADVEIALPSMHELLPVAEHAAEARPPRRRRRRRRWPRCRRRRPTRAPASRRRPRRRRRRRRRRPQPRSRRRARSRARRRRRVLRARTRRRRRRRATVPTPTSTATAARRRRRAATAAAKRPRARPQQRGGGGKDDAAAAAEPTEAEAARQREKEKLELYFVGWADAVELHVPIRGKYCKKHGRIVGARRNFLAQFAAQFSAPFSAHRRRRPPALRFPQASLTTTATRWATRWASSTTARSGASSSCRPPRSGRASSCSTTRTSRSAGASCGRRSTRRSSPSTS